MDHQIVYIQFCRIKKIVPFFNSKIKKGIGWLSMVLSLRVLPSCRGCTSRALPYLSNVRLWYSAAGPTKSNQYFFVGSNVFFLDTVGLVYRIHIQPLNQCFIMIRWKIYYLCPVQTIKAVEVSTRVARCRYIWTICVISVFLDFFCFTHFVKKG